MSSADWSVLNAVDKKLNEMRGKRKLASSGKKIDKSKVKRVVDEIKKERNLIKKELKTSKIKKQLVGNKHFMTLSWKKNEDVISGTSRYTAAATNESFYLNDVNKPYYYQASTDPLPQGWSQMQSFFNDFCVKAFRFKITIAPNLSGKNLQFVYQIRDVTDTDNISGQPLDPNGNKRRIYSRVLNLDKPTVITYYQKIHQLYGVPKNDVDTQSIYGGTYNIIATAVGNSSVTQTAILTVGMVNNTDNTAVTLPYKIEIDYYTLSNEYKLQAVATTQAAP